MNKSIKTFACATLASMLLLACNIADDSELSPQAAGDDLSKATSPNPPEMICTTEFSGPENCIAVDKPSDKPNPPDDKKGEYLPPYDPSVSIITEDVEKWMEEQLASKSGEKRLIMISDMHLPETTPPGLSASGYKNEKGEYSVEYFLNGEKISAEEYNRIQAEYRKGINTGKRNLSIPGEIKQQDSRSWTVLITAEQLAELLSKKYGELAIDFYREYTNDV